MRERLVSPYLRRRLRTLEEALAEVAALAEPAVYRAAPAEAERREPPAEPREALAPRP